MLAKRTHDDTNVVRLQADSYRQWSLTHVTPFHGCCYNLHRYGASIQFEADTSFNTRLHKIPMWHPQHINMILIHALDITCHFGTIQVSDGQSPEVQYLNQLIVLQLTPVSHMHIAHCRILHDIQCIFSDCRITQILHVVHTSLCNFTFQFKLNNSCSFRFAMPIHSVVIYNYIIYSVQDSRVNRTLSQSCCYLCRMGKCNVVSSATLSQSCCYLCRMGKCNVVSSATLSQSCCYLCRMGKCNVVSSATLSPSCCYLCRMGKCNVVSSATLSQSCCYLCRMGKCNVVSSATLSQSCCYLCRMGKCNVVSSATGLLLQTQ